MITRLSTRIDLKLEDDIYEYEEMINIKLNEKQIMFSPLQCEIEINLNNNLNDILKSDMKLTDYDTNSNIITSNANMTNFSKFNISKQNN